MIVVPFAAHDDAGRGFGTPVLVIVHERVHGVCAVPSVGEPGEGRRGQGIHGATCRRIDSSLGSRSQSIPPFSRVSLVTQWLSMVLRRARREALLEQPARASASRGGRRDRQPLWEACEYRWFRAAFADAEPGAPSKKLFRPARRDEAPSIHVHHGHFPDAITGLDGHGSARTPPCLYSWQEARRADSGTRLTESAQINPRTSICT